MDGTLFYGEFKAIERHRSCPVGLTQAMTINDLFHCPSYCFGSAVGMADSFPANFRLRLVRFVS